jgi:hypothetical protein
MRSAPDASLDRGSAALDSASRRTAQGLFLSLVCLYLLLSTGEPPKGDAFAPFTGAIHLIQGKGIYASKVMPGQTFLLVPIAALTQLLVKILPDDASRWVALVLTADLFPALMTAGSAVVLFSISRAIGNSVRLSALASLVYGLATPAAVYSKNFFPQPTETFFLLLTIWGLVVARHGDSRRPLILSGLAFGMLLLVKAVAIVYLPVFALFVFRARSRVSAGADVPRGESSKHWPRLISWAAPAFALALLFLPYNLAARGDPFAFGYGQGRDALWGFASPILTGLHGLLLSPGKGFFYYAPVLVLAFPGAVALWRRDRAVTLLLTGIAVAMLVFHARWWAWHGDNAWGPRYLVPALPLVTLLAAEFVRGMCPCASVKTVVVIALIVISCGVQGLGGAFGNDVYQTLTYDTVVPRYREEMGPHGPRDDEIHLHWFPSFSPLVGNAWLLSHVMRRDPPMAYLADYPWRVLRPDGAWAPRMPEAAPRLDLWVLRLPEKHPTARGLVMGAALVALAGACAGAVTLRRGLSQANAAEATGASIA